MPIEITSLSGGGTVYGSPFIGPVSYVMQIDIDVTALTTREVDSDGYLKPGVPFLASGALVSAPAQSILGVVIEALRVAGGNAAGDFSAASAAHQIGLATIGQINRDVVEDNMGAAFTADELDAFSDIDCHIIVSAT